MKLKKHLPNIFTLLNLLAGIIAVIYAVENQLAVAAFFVFLGIFFNFFDGFFARLLKVQGELGKQLDSLADVVTSGVAPAIVLYKLLETYALTNVNMCGINVLPFVGLLLALAAAYRLAKFNIDTRQTSSFIGLPTPAAAIVVMALPLILEYSTQVFVIELIKNQWFLIGLTLLLSFLMNAKIPLFALKFKSYAFKENALKYLFLVSSVLLLVCLQFVALPLVILLYVLLSVVKKK